MRLILCDFKINQKTKPRNTGALNRTNFNEKNMKVKVGLATKKRTY